MMTTDAAAPYAPSSLPRTPSRTLSVVRMQLINRQTYIWIPLIILGGAFLLALAVYAMLANAGVTGPKYGGGAQAPLWYFGVVGIQALTLTFPFSQAMSVTRREFFLGTLAHRGAHLVDPRRDRGRRRPGRTGDRRVGRERMVLRTAVDVGGRTARRAAGQLRRSDAVLRDRILGGDDLQALRRIALTFVLVGIGALLVAGMWLIGRLDAWASVLGWFSHGRRGRAVAVGSGTGRGARCDRLPHAPARDPLIDRPGCLDRTQGRGIRRSHR